MPQLSKSADRYRVASRGLEWTGPGDEPRRAEPGDLVDDLPAASLAGLLADGLITKEG